MVDEAATENETLPPEAAADAPGLSDETKALAAQGFAVQDGWPANHRLRAETLVAAGLTSDPARHIDDDLIAQTADRLKVEAAEAAKREAADAKGEKPATARMGRDKLIELAAPLGVLVNDDDSASTIADNINAARAAADTKEG